MNIRFAVTKGLLLTAMLIMPMIASAEAGKVTFVFGQAWLDSADGTRQEVVKGMSFENGDHFSTAATGRVQLRMADGGLIALRPSTEFVIEEFSYAGSDAGTADSQDRSFFSLVKGGFRSITGAVGKKDKSAYRVRTPVATIGIRGTDYDAVYCEAACEPGDTGLYVGVTEGGVILTNAAGSLELGPGQYGYVADEDSAPEMSAGEITLVVVVLGASNIVPAT
ncbi:MAG: FecR domain-containing protein [Proteobacteria bacterium]|nr:FecR domain-containing protein [Pseudomonadota bacterium]